MTDLQRPNFLADAFASQGLPDALSHLTQYARGTSATEGLSDSQLRGALGEARQRQADISRLDRDVLWGPAERWERPLWVLAGFVACGAVVALAPFLLGVLLGSTPASSGAAAVLDTILGNLRFVLVVLGVVSAVLLACLAVVHLVSTRGDRARLRAVQRPLAASVSVLENALRERGARPLRERH